MAYCEDYPCCGHGPPPMGDGGGCPDSQGRFRCVECGARLPKRARSSICERCLTRRSRMTDDEREYEDERREAESDFGY